MTVGRAANPAAVSFDGVNDYITFGQAAGLGGKKFTVECWFKRTGLGVAVSTGTGGITAIPLVTKGCDQAEGDNRDMNFFLGIRSSDNVLAADFEEGSSGATPGLNHPIAGLTILVSNVWYHAAATYDGTNISLYLNGKLDASLSVGQPPRWDSIQHAGIGTALNSAGTAAGFFKGEIDGVRIWKTARTAEQLYQSFERDDISAEALSGQWALNEAIGTAANDSSWNAVHGTLINGPAWVAGVPPCTVLGIAPAPAPLLTCPTMNYAFDFDDLLDMNQYNHFELENAGDAARYARANFTIETWFRRDGCGQGANTGASGTGIDGAIPLVSKGGGGDQVESPPAANMNYFLGIGPNDPATAWVVVGDFEDTSGGNHPLRGTTEIIPGRWYHAAITLEGSTAPYTFRLYVNGVQEDVATSTLPAEDDSRIRASVATARNDQGAGGTRVLASFQGAMDEIRIWQIPRSATEIARDRGIEFVGVLPIGLIGYWKLNSTSGSTAIDSAGSNNRTIDGLSPGDNWVPRNETPSVPQLVSPPSPADGATGISGPVTLQVRVSDVEGDPLQVQFYGRPRNNCAGLPFRVIAVPDTQKYMKSLDGATPAGFYSQIKWIIDNRITQNIVYVAQLGDCVEDSDPVQGPGQYQIATDIANDAAKHGFYDLERITALLPDGLPYGIAVGNHDQHPQRDPLGSSTSLYNSYFGVSHFNSKSYWGGNFPTIPTSLNDNHYDLFSANGFDFVVIYLEFNDLASASQPNATERALWMDAVNWADCVLKAHPTRRGIIVTHWLIGHGGNSKDPVNSPAAFGRGCNTCEPHGQLLYDRLKLNRNLTLMLCGHVSEEGIRADIYAGNRVTTMLSDYQGIGGEEEARLGGNGWLRILEFSPAENKIFVKTYTPFLNAPNGKYETDPDSQFEVPYDMEPYVPIGGVLVPDANGMAAVVWPGLLPDTQFEWYVTVTDGCTIRTGPTWRFTTAPNPGGLPTVTITPWDAIASEPDAGCVDTGHFILTRSRNSCLPLTVNFSTAGSTATSGSDYPSIGTSVTFPANAFSITIDVKPIDDNNYEPDETVVVTLSANANYIVDSTYNTATVTIQSVFELAGATEVYAVNDNGQAASNAGRHNADGTLAETYSFAIYGINNAGDVVGNGYARIGGVTHNLGLLNGAPTVGVAINSRKSIAGHNYYHSCYWTYSGGTLSGPNLISDGPYADIDDWFYNSAYGTDYDVMFGGYSGNAYAYHPYCTWPDLLPWAISSGQFPQGINKMGTVVGWEIHEVEPGTFRDVGVMYHPCYYDSSYTTILDYLPDGASAGASIYPRKINSSDLIVGDIEYRACLRGYYSGGQWHYLDNIIGDPSWSFGGAYDISDAGHIVGCGVHSGQGRCFLIRR